MEKGRHHTEHKVSVHVGEKLNKSNTCCCSSLWKWSAVIFLILFIVSVITAGFTTINQCSNQNSQSTNSQSTKLGTSLSKEQISANVVKYISSAANANVTLVNISEERGLYVVTLTVGGTPYVSYATKDGGLLFPSGLDLTKAPTPSKAANTGSANVAPLQNFNKTKVPTVYLFTMAYCPYGNQADDAMAPVANLIKDKALIEPHYVIYANYKGGGSDYCLDNGNYCSMHGIQELNEDVRELCIYKYEKTKFWKFVLDVNKACTAQNVDTCWEAVALSNSIDTAKIKTCEQDEALLLLENEVKLNIKYSVRGSPTLIINDQLFTGARSAQGYLDGLCSAFTTKPAECNNKFTSTSTTPVASGACG